MGRGQALIRRVGGAVLLALLVTLLSAGVSAGREVESEPPPEVPEALLGSGSIDDFRWAVHVGRDSEENDPQRPCFKVSTGEGSEAGYGTSARTCSSLDRDPLVNGLGSGAGDGARTVLAMAFQQRVRSVRLWLKGRKSRRIQLRRLNAEQAEFTGLARFRYLVEDFTGPFCLQRYASFNAAGERLAISPSYECAWNWRGDREPS
ncbi:MAG TPA: hypothetical protein VI039_05795 [Solirubrobacterales bacterium]